MADQQNTMTLAQWQAIQASQQAPATQSAFQPVPQQHPSTIQPMPQPTVQVPTAPMPQPFVMRPTQAPTEVPAQFLGKPIGEPFKLVDGVISVEACARWTSAGRFDGQTLGGTGFIAGNH
ncbi:MAG: hypothetical protein FD180_1972 [Planctomycetota bacterium]|nr:MAG: hypothetical protein FD180_1972 [Planctomycetota bacterium]